MINIEAFIIAHLMEELHLPVYGDVPVRDKPDRYVTVERVGGSKEDTIHGAMIALQSYAPTRYEASELNDSVCEAMESIYGRDEICSISLNSTYNYPKTDEKQPRYQAVYDVKYY